MEPTQINFSVRKSDAGRWVCEFSLYDQEHQFTGSEPSEAVMAALEFVKTKGDVNKVELVRVSDNGSAP